MEKINDFRVLYNRALTPIGYTAPDPKAGETVGGYRRRSMQIFADSLLPQTHKFAKMDWGPPTDTPIPSLSDRQHAKNRNRGSDPFEIG
jgi:hypothetical protein